MSSEAEYTHCTTQESPLEKEARTYAEKRLRRRQRRLLAGQALLLTTASAVGAYWADVHTNQDRQASSEASISVYDTPLHPENDSSAVVFFNGFGTYDADPIASTFGPGIKQSVDGESWSVSYGNAPLDSKKLAEHITALANERNITTIDIVGYSAGGVIGIDTATELAKTDTVTIRSITTVSTPDGIDGLRPHQKKELEFADTFASIPGAKYSTAVRFAGELYFMRNRFDEGSITERASDLGKTAIQAIQHLQKPKLPGTWLLVDQTLAIADADIATNLREIAQTYGDSKPLPTLLYIGTAAPGRDYMVNNELSSHRICGYAYENDMECSIHDVPGAVHTMPEKTVDAYTQTFSEAKNDLKSGIGLARLQYIETFRQKRIEELSSSAQYQAETMDTSG